jgi:hypothetical protein
MDFSVILNKKEYLKINDFNDDNNENYNDNHNDISITHNQTKKIKVLQNDGNQILNFSNIN